ncbi:hypothetical protein [Caproicibacter fermentans]|uniref:Uncharacterized protein n=1 Tax=Caproicibacter fermentans TaxID=2576756 RepID=A0A7G8TF71_9FIRM|nr:hypothetical protein [Caproicibacter fermentans]QNK42262.1 hypothetical protein HCR03_08665 [Caproicibacter fermentans]
MNEIEMLNRIKSAVEAETPEIFENILITIKKNQEALITDQHLRKNNYKNFHT